MKNLLVPEDIIRSVKDEKNKVLPGKNYSAISNEKTFMSPVNVKYITKYMYLKHRQNGGKSPRVLFEKSIPLMMKSWSVKENLDSFEGWNNYHWVLTMDYINDKFMKDHKEYYTMQGSDTNVFKAHVPVGHQNEYDGVVYETKKLDEFNHIDMQNYDVWGKVEAFTQNKSVYRYKNSIPFWQSSVHTRNYSLENEGLRSNSWARASLETPQRGYATGMDHITATTGREKDLSWTDF